jgi:hypothetical protein
MSDDPPTLSTAATMATTATTPTRATVETTFHFCILPRSGVDVLIAIFCDFLPIFCEKIGVFLKNQCYDKICSKTRSSFSKKRQYFRQMFRKK